jgi:hypothetical protein
MVHMTSSWRSRESKVEDDQSDSVRSGTVSRTEIPFITCNFFQPVGHFSLLVGPTNRINGG